MRTEKPISWCSRLSPLRGWKARRLSRSGSHAAALAQCSQLDLEVLSRAGMHLAVLKFGRRRSLYSAIALSLAGSVEEAVLAGQMHFQEPLAVSLIGRLAVRAPEQIWPIVPPGGKFAEIRRYCELEARLVPVAARAINEMTPLMGLSFALANGWDELASERLRALFVGHGLEPPLLQAAGGRLDLHAIPRRRGRVDGGGSPVVSVILTAHNEQQYLPFALQSLLDQTWSSLEVIVVDDGSTDDTAGIADAFATEDPRVRVVRLEERVGTWEAKNIGLSLARGSLFTMHDADDWSHPFRLELQAKPLVADPRLMCSSSCFVRIDEDTGRPFTRNATSFLRWNPSSLMYRREVISELGNYFTGMMGADCEFAARIETHWGVASHLKLRKPLALGWQRRGSLSDRHRVSKGRMGEEQRLRDWEAWRRLHARAFAIDEVTRIREQCPETWAADV